MSILAAAAVDKSNAPGFLVTAGLVVVVMLIAKVALWRRPDALLRPDRIPPWKSGWPLFWVAVSALVIWFFSQMVYGVIVMARRQAAGEPAVFDESALSPADWAVLATAPALIGMIALLIGDRLTGPDTPNQLGLSTRSLPRGVMMGGLAMVVVVPVMLGVAIGVDQLYKVLQYQHPTEHALLKVLGGSTNQTVRAFIILGAVTGAPLFEELLFRGHLQTLLRRLFGSMFRRTEPPAFPVIPDDVTPAFPVTAPTELPPVPLPPPIATPYTPPPITPAATWAAIIVTSLAFAFIHETWTAPMIFVLSVCLGYAYERTGNLWVPMTMHAVFNGANTLVFVLAGSQQQPPAG